ncbi:MAG: methionine--tRNA ligase [Planctomycetota bacterium]|nr:MAG: methionine--tRNA ligase [Planctomycetota bacterium]
MPTSPHSPDLRPLMITSALPYANGPIHFGHIAGAYLPADVYARFQRMLGADVAFICGTDEHGVSITVKAEAEGVPYREYVARWHNEISAFFSLFDIAFDHFSRTSNEDPHYALSQEVFLRLLRAGNVAPRDEQQHYCTDCERFLPDRYVEGTCYLCGAAARGDECKGCGSWLEAIKLVDPRCATCGHTPEVRDTVQFELDLSPISSPERDTLVAAYGEAFADWLPAFRRVLKTNVRTMAFDKLIEGEGLRPRPITRDLRWGVPVPAVDLDGQPVPDHEGKVLYVWFDAPIGYVSATIEWAREHLADGDAWRRWWITAKDTPTGSGPRLVHFLGKDNIPFHCIVFPAMQAGQAEARPDETPMGPRHGERWVLPENVPANEFYNLEGRKFSTSDNWMLGAEHMFEVFGIDALRWYVIVSMPETADSNFLLDELQARVNSELADTIGNYASRVLKFNAKQHAGVVPEVDAGHELAADLAAVSKACEHAVSQVAELLGGQQFRRAAAAAVDLARFGNKLFDERAPWKLKKTDEVGCRAALHANLQVLATLSMVLTPFVPVAAGRLREMLALPAIDTGARPGAAAHAASWRVETLLAGHALGEPGILFAKIDDDTIAAEKARLGAAPGNA